MKVQPAARAPLRRGVRTCSSASVSRSREKFLTSVAHRAGASSSAADGVEAAGAGAASWCGYDATAAAGGMGAAAMMAATVGGGASSCYRHRRQAAQGRDCEQ